MAEDFRHDGQRDFRRCRSAKVETDGRADAPNFVDGKTRGGQAFDALGVVFSRTERADIKALGTTGELQRFVVDMADMGESRDGRVGIELQFRQCILRPVGNQFDAGKARFGSERGARIDDDGREPGCAHEFGKNLADMGGADDEDARRRQTCVNERLASCVGLHVADAGEEARRDIGR